jgi:hypothetical protein
VSRLSAPGVQKGKELNDVLRYLLDLEIPSNLRFSSLEIRDTITDTIRDTRENPTF